MTDSAATKYDLRWPEHKITLCQYRGRTYLSARDLLAFLAAVETTDSTARQVLEGLRRQIESVV